MDVGAWLRGLGLGQYEQAFRDNRIDARVLPKLTAEDLREIGITAVGHRRLLQEAIATLGVAPGSPDPSAPSATAERAARRAPERRQLTVMFVDLVGSTALSARLDPEEMRAVLRAYQDAVAGEVTRFEGHVAKYMGDGVLAYFGYPHDHEDDAERAVRAGLAVVTAVASLRAPGGEPLTTRVGVATGLVVVGDLVGEGAAQEEAVVGETPNLAARLQALAEPGSVVISQATRWLVGGLFELADLGAHDLKGVVEPVPAWRVLGPSRAEGRFEALRAPGLTPLVGREPELGLLLEHWQRAKEGEGQVVLLSGEPGIGKSRAIRALRQRLGDEPYTPLNHYCSPYHTNSTLHPVIGLLERATRLDRDDRLEEQLTKLEAVLGRSSDRLEEVVPLLAALLGVPTGERYPTLALTPEAQKRRTLQVLVDQLTALATQQPVLALYEDVHWMDPTTAELLGLVIDRVRDLPVLVIITFRPEFTPPWKGLTHVTPLALGRLSRRQGGAMVERVTGGKALPREVVEEINAKADGIPLFVEELTKVALETGFLKDDGDRYALTGLPPRLAIPATLQDSLMARLDRLGPAKEVAQVAAVIGREFPHDLLAAVASPDGEALNGALDTLVEAELVFRYGLPPAASYSFKHALIRDAAYQSLLKSKRRTIHARVASALQTRFADIAERNPELLGHHLAEAGAHGAAMRAFRLAGERAFERSANAEAISHLRAALRLLDAADDETDRDLEELRLQLALGKAIIAAESYAAPEAGQVFTRARALCSGADRRDDLVAALAGEFLFQLNRGAFAAAEELAAELVRLGDDPDQLPAVLLGLRGAAICELSTGRLDEAREHFERMLELAERPGQFGLALAYGLDPVMAGLVWLAVDLLLLGLPVAARAKIEEGLQYAGTLAHLHSRGFALVIASILYHLAGDRSAMASCAEAAATLAREQGFRYLGTMAAVQRGLALVDELGDEAVREMEAGFAEREATGTALARPYFRALLAEAHEAMGAPARAAALLDLALADAAETGECWYEAEIRRRRAHLFSVHGDLAAAEAALEAALSSAGRTGAKMWALRAARDLARLRAERGERAEARDLLAPVYGWFTEGFDTPDLKDAKALLDGLR